MRTDHGTPLQNTLFSGQGIQQIYSGVCSYRSEPQKYYETKDVVEAALQDESDDLAREALNMYRSLLGNFCGNTASMVSADEVVIGGGVATRSNMALDIAREGSPFRTAFGGKGIGGETHTLGVSVMQTPGSLSTEPGMTGARAALTPMIQ